MENHSSNPTTSPATSLATSLATTPPIQTQAHSLQSLPSLPQPSCSCTATATAFNSSSQFPKVIDLSHSFPFASVSSGQSNAHQITDTGTSTPNFNTNVNTNTTITTTFPTSTTTSPDPFSVGPSHSSLVHVAAPASTSTSASAAASSSAAAFLASPLPSAGVSFPVFKSFHPGSTSNLIDINTGFAHRPSSLSATPLVISNTNSIVIRQPSPPPLGSEQSSQKLETQILLNAIRKTSQSENKTVEMETPSTTETKTTDLKENNKPQESKGTFQSLKDEVEDLKADLSSLRKCVTCVICQNLLFEPYSLHCGHIFCYMCLLEWFHRKKSCPECRAMVDRLPAPAYLVRDMIETFVARAELTSPHGAGAELRSLQKQALQAVEKDKASAGKGRKGGLFQGLFLHKPKQIKIGVRDDIDGVLRCPDCVWEVVGGICEQCGQRIRDTDEDNDDYDDWSDEDMDEDELEEDDSDSITSESEEEEDDDSVMTRGEGFVDYPAWVEEYSRRRIGTGSIAAILAGDQLDPTRARRATDSIDPVVGDQSNPIAVSDDTRQLGRHEEDEDEVRAPGRRRNSASTSRSTGGQASRNSNRTGSSRNIIDLTSEWGRSGFSITTRRMDLSGFDFDDSDDDDEEEENEGSLDGFIADDHDDPRRGNAHHRRARSTSTVATDATTVTASSTPSSSTGDSGPHPQRRNRRVVLDEDEEEAENDDIDDESNVSEVSPRVRHVHFTSMSTYSRRRGPIALSSDNDEEEEDLEDDSMLGYTPLDHDTEGDEDDDLESRPRAGTDTPSGRVTFSLREEDEDDRDTEGDVTMGDSSHPVSRETSEPLSTASNFTTGSRRRRASTPTTSSTARRTRRATTNEGGGTDSDNSDLEYMSRPTLSFSRSHITSLRHRNSSSNHRRPTVSSRRDIDPGISRILRRHVQQRTELEFDRLANFSNSPARSLTPVPSNPNGNVSGNNNSTRAQLEVSSIDLTSSPVPAQQYTRETSVETSATASTITSQSPRMRAASISTTSQTSTPSQSSSPFPSGSLSGSLSGIASFVASSSHRSSSTPAVTPPPPRTTVPTRSSSTFANTTNNPNNQLPPISNTVEQSHHVRPLHHREHARPPATSPQSPPPIAIHNRSQTVAQRRSRNQLRGTGSRPDMRERRSRNELRNLTPTPAITQSNSGTNTNATRREPTSAQPSTSLTDTIAEGALARQPSTARVRRFTPEEIREMGTAYMSRRLHELRQQQRSGNTAANGSNGNTASAATRPAPAVSTNRPANALSHWRALPNGSDPGIASSTSVNMSLNTNNSRVMRRQQQPHETASSPSTGSSQSSNGSSATLADNSRQTHTASGTGMAPARRLGVGIGTGSSTGGPIFVFGTAQQDNH